MKKSKVIRTKFPMFTAGGNVSPQAQSEKLLAELKETNRLLRLIIERLDK